MGRCQTYANYLDAIATEARRRTPFQIAGQVLIDVLEHHVQHQLLLVFQARSVTDVQQPSIFFKNSKV